MFSDYACHEGFEVLVKLGREWCVVAKLRELAVDSPNDLDIVMFDKLQIFLLILFGKDSDKRVKLLVQFALLILQPIWQAEVVLLLVAEQPHHLEQQFEEGQHEHAAGVLLEMEGFDVLDGEVELLHVAELVVQLLLVCDHWVFVGS